MSRAARVAIVLFVACGGGPTAAPRATPAAVSGAHTLRAAGHPTVVSLDREGDPQSGVAVLLATDGADAPGAVAVALGAVLSAKLDPKYGARVTPMATGVRIDALFESPVIAAGLTEAIRGAVVLPVDDASWTAASQALDRTPHYDGPEARVVACQGAVNRERPLSKAELEAALGRIVASVGLVGKVGDGPRTIGSGAVWPQGARACRGSDEPRISYELHGVRAARADIVSWQAPDRAIELATGLGPLVAKLHAADADARMTAVSAVAEPSGGCLDVRIELPSTDPSSIAKLAAIALTEVNLPPDHETAGKLPSDPRDAAAVLASEELSLACSASKASVIVGVAADAGDKLDAQLRSSLTAASAAWAAPAAPTLRKIEAGQPEAWVLVASPCGTRTESTAGATLEGMEGLARQASATQGIDAEPVVSGDVAGILVRSHQMPGESPVAFGRRLGEAAGRAFGIEPLVTSMALGSPDDAFSLLAATLVADHPNWIDPRIVARSSKNMIDARIDAIRRGPVRVLVLSNEGAAQVEALAAGVDRFLLRHDTPSCSPDPHVEPPKPGTYFMPKPGASEAYLALPVGADPSCSSAPFLVASLPGVLSPALAGVARSSEARLVVAPTGRFLVVHLDAPSGSLDAAVSQTRALFDRLRQGALREADLSRAVAIEEQSQKTAALDPRIRVIRAWRGEDPPPRPSLDGLRSCARATFRDEALVIAAARSTMSP